MDKEAKLLRVAEAALKILVQSGLRGVTHSALSRNSGVSRAWIYKYIGKERDALVLFSLELLGRLFSDIDQPPFLSSREKWEQNARSNLLRTLENAKKTPWLVHIYYRFRHTETPIGQKLVDLERKYLARIGKEIEAAYNTDAARAKQAAESHMIVQLALAHRALSIGTAQFPDFSNLVIDSVRGAL